MASNQEGRHAAVRLSTGTSRSHDADWHALFDAAGIAAGAFNGRLLAWINIQLASSYSNLNGAMTAYAVSQGFTRWTDMSTIALGPGGAANAFLLEDGTSGILLEAGSSYLLMEV